MNQAETVRISLPIEIIQKYEHQAKERGGNPAEWLMSERLRQYASVDSQKPVTLDDVSRRRIEKAFGKNFSTADELVKMIEQSTSVDVNGVQVPLKPQLMQRLNTRAIGVPFTDFLPKLLTRLLEEYCGLR